MILFPIIFIGAFALMWWIAWLTLKLLAAILRRTPFLSVRGRQVAFIVAGTVLVTPMLSPQGLILGLIPFELAYVMFGRQVLGVPFWLPLTYWPFVPPTALFCWWLARGWFAAPVAALET